MRLIALGATLRQCQLFSGLSEEDITRIASFVQPRALAKDEYLFRESEPAVGFYVVQRGAINVHRVNAQGKEQVIHVFRPGESMGEAAMASPTGYPAAARAVEQSNVLLVPKADILELVSERPDLALRMLGSMSQHLRVLVGLVDDLTLKDVETRLARWIIRHCDQSKGPPCKISLGRTKRVLAAEIGTTAETLSRTLARFRDASWIEVGGSVLTVHNGEALKAMVAERLGGA
ncbi:Crp/Fnr family transcriptional regulator [Actomonas aquatica]|uniref:Crp/Fnr family transcriptional regulator n=1 Tax=Actomonas aquatica TaxID=2866162 RepID=A0ABZ1C4A7_9BACT|nr:Crp/Fnr family transcriptional regulator [Opitutus sp. WL0086]WRQ86534.1 Crp/Fnr family transcriptional regulator [Opitutus sp. WL0086]